MRTKTQWRALERERITVKHESSVCLCERERE